MSPELPPFESRFHESSRASALETLHSCIDAIVSRGKTNSQLLVGVAGTVGSGKTFWTNYLAEGVPGGYCRFPFELWIDQIAVESRRFPYPRRFNLSSYYALLHDLSDASSLEQIALARAIDLRGNGHETSWRSGIAGSRFTAYVDGTLAYHESARRHFDLTIFIEAPWELRTARIIGRCLRKERRFGSTLGCRDYLLYLLDEALTTADEIIQQQSATADIVIDSASLSKTDLEDLRTLGTWIERSYIPETYKLNAQSSLISFASSQKGTAS